MATTSPFEQYATEYDQWFEDHRPAYESELEAIRTLLPGTGTGMEVGIGTGRFAAPLGIHIGVEPSQAMREIAQSRNINAMNGVAEALPFPDGSYDYVLFVTTICFVNSLEQAFAEAHRVLKPGGSILVGFVNRNSALGREYEKKRNESRFYREAVFRSVEEIATSLDQAGFGAFQYVETLFHPLAEIVKKEPVKEGYGKGAFVVVKAVKNSPESRDQGGRG